jgi:5-methylcytosine-specific restriction endonuclease McrA
MPPDWARTRRRILRRDPTCRIGGPLCTRRSTEVDHVIRGGGDHDANLRGVCAACHKAKTAVEAAACRWGGRR